MQVEQYPEMSEEDRKKMAKLLNQEPAAFDSHRALFDSFYETMNLAPIKRAAHESGRITTVFLHAPGDIVTMTDGRRYQVDDDGKWIRLDK